jgi:hypothetical protein
MENTIKFASEILTDHDSDWAYPTRELIIEKRLLCKITSGQISRWLVIHEHLTLLNEVKLV